MTPGRGNMPKTGRGISPTLMSKSPMYQTGEVEYTGQGRMKVKETQARIKKDPKKTAEYDTAMGLTRNPATNELKANAYEKKYLPGGEGQADRIIDGAGKLVSESKGSSPGARKKLKAEFDRAKLITDTQRSENAEGLNAFQGNTKPENLNEKQKKSMLNSTRVKLSESPAKQVSKGAFKKTTVVPADKKPKASKTPMKQYIDPKDKERQKKRFEDMTPSQRKAEGTDKGMGKDKIKREGPTGPPKGRMDSKVVKKSPAMQMSKLKKKC